MPKNHEQLAIQHVIIQNTTACFSPSGLPDMEQNDMLPTKEHTVA